MFSTRLQEQERIIKPFGSDDEKLNEILLLKAKEILCENRSVGWYYQPSTNGMVKDLFKSLDHYVATCKKPFVFYDMGCGIGRVVLAVAHKYGANVIAKGVDFQAKYIKEAEKNAKKLGIKAEFICSDATIGDWSDGDFFYLFNPFGHTVEAKFYSNLVPKLNKDIFVHSYYSPELRARQLQRLELDHRMLYTLRRKS